MSSLPTPVFLMKGDMGPIHCLLFRDSVNFEHLYAGAQSGTVHIWDLQKNRELLRLDSLKDPCLGLNIFNNEYLVTQRKGGALNFWLASNSTWEINKTFETNYYAYCRSQKLTDDALIIPLNNSKTGLFSLKTHEIEIKFDPLGLPGIDKLGDVMAIKPVSNESNYVIVAYEVGKLLLFDIRKKKVLSSLTIRDNPMTIDFNKSSMNGVIGTCYEDLIVFSLSDNYQLSLKTDFRLKSSGSSIVAIKPDAKIYAVGCWDRKIRIFSRKSHKQLAILDYHKNTIHDIVYSTSRVEAYNCNCLMAAAGKDGMISLWDLYN